MCSCSISHCTAGSQTHSNATSNVGSCSSANKSFCSKLTVPFGFACSALHCEASAIVQRGTVLTHLARALERSRGNVVARRAQTVRSQRVDVVAAPAARNDRRARRWDLDLRRLKEREQSRLLSPSEIVRDRARLTDCPASHGVALSR